VSPVFIYLSFSFMSDVPALLWIVSSLYFFVRAEQRASERAALIGSGCVGLAFLSRQLGVMIVLAAVWVVVQHYPREQWLRALGVRVLPAAFIVLVYWLWSQNNGEPNWANAAVTAAGTWQLLRTDAVGTLARRLSVTALTLNLYMLPLWGAF